MIKNKYYLLFTFYFLGFGILVAIVVSFINYKSKFTDINKTLNTLSLSELNYKREYLDEYLKNIEMLLNSLSHNKITHDFLLHPSDGEKYKDANSLFYALAFANQDIMQLRYIDEDGKEVIRIDRDKRSSELKIIQKKNMQNKYNRYYFQEALILKKNEFWYSKIDLNMERGKIEIPYKPTLRIATPLIQNGKKKGILIANLLFEDVVAYLSESSTFNVYLVDKNGEIIHDPIGKNSWSNYLDNRYSIEAIFPEETKNILTQVSFKTLNLYSYGLGDLFKNDENVKIIFDPKIHTVEELKDKNIVAALLIALTVIIVSIPLSWLVSIIPSQLQIKLADSYNKIRKSSNIIDNYIMISKTDANGGILEISKKFTEITGYTQDEILGKKLTILKHPETTEDVHQNLWQTISSGKVWHNEMQDVNKAGKSFWIDLVITPEFNEKNQIQGYTAIAQDITDKKVIEKMLITDPLTKLFNRRKIEEVLESEVLRYIRYTISFSILFIDIDKFKHINDTYGHNIGDTVLQEVSSILHTNSRPTDYVGRWGGEEFIIVASQTDMKEAYKYAEVLRKKIESHSFENVPVVTISCGVNEYKSNQPIKDFLSQADEALYQAKESGRNQVKKA